MIIPVRCVTCNKVIADKWRWYCEQLAASQASVTADNAAGAAQDDSFDPDSAEAVLKRTLFDRMGLVRYCCRRHFMGQVDLVNKL
jgi:DNA-directed RNA polymerase subunit N (RpoN/RPB10)